MDIVADTNRDGQIGTDDESGKNQPSPGRGAIFNVNPDRDNANPAYPDPDFPNLGYSLVPNDGLTLDTNGRVQKALNEDGTVQGDDLTINGPNDVADVTPFRVRIQPATEPGWRYFLQIDADSAQAVHFFPSLNPGAVRVLGGPSLLNPDGTPSVLEKEITDGFTDAGLDRTFGIEALAFRGMGLPLARLKNDPYKFGGTAVVTVVARKYDAGGNVVRSVSDTILLKVAPFILRSNADASKELWVDKDPSGAKQPLLDTLESALANPGNCERTRTMIRTVRSGTKTIARSATPVVRDSPSWTAFSSCRTLRRGPFGCRTSC